jgi:Tol biopolymer transport system component
MTKLKFAILGGLAALAAPAPARDSGLAAKVKAFGRINSATSPSTSSDGRRLAYLSNESGSPQIWVRDLRSGVARQITRLSDPVGSVYWSPKGDQLAYTVLPGGGLNTQVWVMNADGRRAGESIDRPSQ